MRLAAVRERTEAALIAAGFQPASFVWIDKPNRLVVAIAGRVRILTLKGSSKATLERMIGRIEGWKDMAA